MKACTALMYLMPDGEYTSVLAEAIYHRIEAMKRITKLSISQEDVNYVISCADAINSENEFATASMGMRFEDILFPECLKFLIYPGKVSLSSLPRSMDLVRRPNVDEKYDAIKMSRIIEGIYGSQKRGGEYVNIVDLRKKVLVSDISWCSPFHDEDWMYLDAENYPWPIPLSASLLDCYGQQYVNEMAMTVMLQYIARWRIEIHT